VYTGVAHLLVRVVNPETVDKALASEGLVANNELAIEQGTKMGRRGILRIQVNLEPELSGTGIVVLSGVLRL
jgi:predicted PhzF superfamily epimerase YddE/YHI9